MLAHRTAHRTAHRIRLLSIGQVSLVIVHWAALLAGGAQALEEERMRVCPGMPGASPSARAAGFGGDAGAEVGRDFHGMTGRFGPPDELRSAGSWSQSVMTLMNTRCLVPQLGDVLVPLPGREATGRGANPPDGVLDVQVPEPGRAVVAAAGQRVPVGAERHRVHGGGTAGQGLAERPGVRGIADIPQPDRAVGVAAGHCVPVGAERDRIDVGCAAGQRLAERPGVRGIGDIPQPDHPVRITAGQCVPISAERH